MVVRISKKPSKKKLAETARKVASKKNKQKLGRFFGKVDYGTDGLMYQKEIRKDD